MEASEVKPEFDFRIARQLPAVSNTLKEVGYGRGHAKFLQGASPTASTRIGLVSHRRQRDANAMVKLYLRYAPRAAYGVVTSGPAIFDWSGKLCVTAALEGVNVWNMRQLNLVVRLAEVSDAGKKASSEVTVLERSPDGLHSGVSALHFHKGGNLLTSGSRDTDIIVWDIMQEQGLYRLKGHRDMVTDVRFLGTSNRLVSCSKDTFVKVWDLDTQHCIQTLVGHRTEVWSFDVHPTEPLLVTAAADSKLRVWRAVRSDDVAAAPLVPAVAVNGEKDGAGKADEEQRHEWTEAGEFERQSKERVVALRFHHSGRVLACHTADRTVEFFRMNDAKEAKKRQKKRLRKTEKKTDAAPAANTIVETESVRQVSDEFSTIGVLREAHKIKSFAFGAEDWQMLLSLSNNTLVTYELDKSKLKQSNTALFKKGATVALPGHRSDVRALAVSSDDQLLASGSSEEVKLWNARGNTCLRTMASGYVLSILFLPGNKHILAGTKEGRLELFDAATGELLESNEAHTGAVWSITLRPDQRGVCSASADKQMKFWGFDLVPIEGSTAKRLTLVPEKTQEMTDDVLAVKYSRNNKFLAAALLDNTVKVFFADSLKFYLSLYGHKLPVLAMDISSDSTMLVSGSADKNLKVWGLDFGDCRRSLFAHQDSIMSVTFVPNTHYLFSVSKDRTVKYWDMDKFEQLSCLYGHQSEIWSVVVTSVGDLCFTGSHDRSLRVWERTEDQFVLEEAREERLQAVFDEDMEKESLPNEAQAEVVGKKTQESITAGERLVDALQLADTEAQNWRLYDFDLQRAKEMNSADVPPPPTPSPFLLGQTPSVHLLNTLTSVRASILEEALLVLPFASVCKMLMFVDGWLRQGLETELICRVMFFLLRVHQTQLAANRSLLPFMRSLQHYSKEQLRREVQVIGFNKAAMTFLKRTLDAQVILPADAAPPKRTKKDKKGK